MLLFSLMCSWSIYTQANLFLYSGFSNELWGNFWSFYFSIMSSILWHALEQYWLCYCKTTCCGHSCQKAICCCSRCARLNWKIPRLVDCGGVNLTMRPIWWIFNSCRVLLWALLCEEVRVSLLFLKSFSVITNYHQLVSVIYIQWSSVCAVTRLSASVNYGSPWFSSLHSGLACFLLVDGHTRTHSFIQHEQFFYFSVIISIITIWLVSFHFILASLSSVHWPAFSSSQMATSAAC